jgi:hypothetical protein
MKKSQIKGLWRGKVLGVLVLALAIGLMAAPGAQAALIDLGLAGPQNWAVLAGGEGLTVDGTGSQVIGPVAANVGSIGNVTFTATPTIAGNLVVDTGATVTGSATIGGVFQQDAAGDAFLASSFADAVTRNAFYGGLATTPGFEGFANITNANNDINITGQGLVVINVTSFVGLTQDINITGGAGDGLVLNLPAFVPGIVAFNAIGVDPLNILYNSTVVGTSYEMLNDIDGIWLAPFSEFAMGSLTLTGTAVAEEVHMHSNVTVNNPFVPVPPSVYLFGSGLLGLGLVGGRKWFHKS